MTISKGPLLRILSFFKTGLISSKMPGTVASIVGTLLLVLMPRNAFLTGILALLLFVIGTIAAHFYVVKYKYDTNKDPSYVVIDEVCGIFVGALILYQFNVTSNLALLINLFLFRFFDIIKPFPIRNIEAAMKKRPQTIALGIMLDDVIAAVISSGIQLLFIK